MKEKNQTEKGKGKKKFRSVGKKKKIPIKISLTGIGLDVQHDLPIKRVLTIKNMDQQFKINLYMLI